MDKSRFYGHDFYQEAGMIALRRSRLEQVNPKTTAIRTGDSDIFLTLNGTVYFLRSLDSGNNQATITKSALCETKNEQLFSHLFRCENNHLSLC